MATYRITATTNSYIAQRDAMFAGNTEVTLESGLSLKEAYKALLDLFNERLEDAYCQNWGMAVIYSRSHSGSLNAYPTFSDGTRSFEYDSRTFTIEEETEY